MSKCAALRHRCRAHDVGGVVGGLDVLDFAGQNSRPGIGAYLLASVWPAAVPPASGHCAGRGWFEAVASASAPCTSVRAMIQRPCVGDRDVV